MRISQSAGALASSSIPPHVDYTLTDLGRSLGAAFCGVWMWAEAHHAEVDAARAAFKARNGEV